MLSNGIDEPIVVYDGATTANKNWFYSDHLGSIVALANTTGAATANYTYSAEGKQAGSAGMRFGYTGQQNLSGLGVQYYKVRMYSADLGRFIQTDPIGMADDMNLYAYVGNNAVNRTDPSGKAAFFWHFGITFAAGLSSGLGVVDSLGVAWDAMAYDFVQNSQLPANANTHYMLEPDQNAAAGLIGIESFIDNQMGLGNSGVASHTTVDGPFHAPNGNLEVWNGTENTSWLDLGIHMIHDTFPSFSTIAAAYNANVNLLSNTTSQSNMFGQVWTSPNIIDKYQCPICCCSN